MGQTEEIYLGAFKSGLSITDFRIYNKKGIDSGHLKIRVSKPVLEEAISDEAEVQSMNFSMQNDHKAMVQIVKENETDPSLKYL